MEKRIQDFFDAILNKEPAKVGGIKPEKPALKVKEETQPEVEEKGFVPLEVKPEPETRLEEKPAPEPKPEEKPINS